MYRIKCIYSDIKDSIKKEYKYRMKCISDSIKNVDKYIQNEMYVYLEEIRKYSNSIKNKYTE
jgi:hypothetical protein